MLEITRDKGKTTRTELISCSLLSAYLLSRIFLVKDSLEQYNVKEKAYTRRKGEGGNAWRRIRETTKYLLIFYFFFLIGWQGLPNNLVCIFFFFIQYWLLPFPSVSYFFLSFPFLHLPSFSFIFLHFLHFLPYINNNKAMLKIFRMQPEVDFIKGVINGKSFAFFFHLDLPSLHLLFIICSRMIPCRHISLYSYRSVLLLCRFHTDSTLIPHWFHTESTLNPHWGWFKLPASVIIHNHFIRNQHTITLIAISIIMIFSCSISRKRYTKHLPTVIIPVFP